MATSPQKHSTKRSVFSDKLVGLLALPLVFAFTVAALSGSGGSAAYEPAQAPSAPDGTSDRLVVILVDSLRPQLLDEGVMPALAAYAQADGAVRMPLRTCKANFSLPCIQTMMEGRPSPFVAGLHNFTGRAGSHSSLPGMLDAGGLEVAMISDHTLDSLYAGHARTSIDVQTWKGMDYLERDLAALERSRKLLEDDALDALLLHLVGTDKSAHQDHPGSADYQRHFGTVDQALGEFLADLDLRRDSVLIVGDHGHNAGGHHTRDSVAIFAGQRYDALFSQLPKMAQINQTDLLYYMAYPLSLPLPSAYEGRLPTADEPSGHLARFQDVQLANLQAAGVAAEGLGLAEAVEQKRKQQEDSRFDPVKKYAPLLLLFALFVARGLASLRRGPTRSDARVLLALLAATVPVTLITSADLGVWLSAPILAAGVFSAWQRGALRAHLLVGLLVAAASLTAAYASQWAEFFHTTGGYVSATPLFYAGLLGAGAIATAVFFRRLHLLPAGMLACAFFCLPSGVYYYQFGQNVLLAGLIGALLVALWWLVSKKRRSRLDLGELGGAGWTSGILAVAAAILLVLQVAGGWEWHLYATNWLRRLPDAVSLGLFGLFGVYWAWRCRSRAQRIAVVAFCVGAAVFCVGLADLSASKFAPAFLPALLLLGFLGARRRLGDGQDELELRPVADGLLTCALSVAALWIVARGFLLQNVDFTFALEWFGGIFSKERDVFVLTYVATLLKYGLPSAAVLLVLRTEAGRARFRAVMAGVALFFGFKIFTLLVQIFAGTAVQTEKYHELAVSDLLFVYALAIASALTYVGVRVVEKLLLNGIFNAEGAKDAEKGFAN